MTASENDVDFDTLIDYKYLEQHLITAKKVRDGDYVFTYADTGVVLGYVRNAPAGNIFLAEKFTLDGSEEEIARCGAGFVPGFVKSVCKARRSLGWTTGKDGKPARVHENALCWLRGKESADEFRDELSRRLVDTLHMLTGRLPRLREKFVWRQKQIRRETDDYFCVTHLYTAFDLERFVNKANPFSEVELLNGRKVNISLLAEEEDFDRKIYRRMIWLVSPVVKGSPGKEQCPPFIVQGYLCGEGELSRVCFLKAQQIEWFKEAAGRL